MKKIKTININNIEVGSNLYTPIIAEIGVNHLGSLNRAKKMVDDAINGGADFIKFQTYIAEKRYDLKTNPKGKLFTDNLKKWQLSKIQEKELWGHAFKYTKNVFTSVYDVESIKFSLDLGTCAFKIAAFEMRNQILLKEVIKTKLPIIISCGICNIKEIRDLVEYLDSKKAKYILLHTVSSYPLEKKYSMIVRIRELIDEFDCPIGHSDHTHGTEIPVLSVAAGASIIEKHFTDNKKYRESDNFFSINKEELKELRFKLNQAQDYVYSPNFIEDDPEKFMRNFIKIS